MQPGGPISALLGLVCQPLTIGPASGATILSSVPPLPAF
jgi:hypothetical protein